MRDSLKTKTANPEPSIAGSQGRTADPPRPTVEALIGIAADGGLLIALMTSAKDGILTDFRIVPHRPSYELLPSVGALCRSSHAIIRDQRAGMDRRAYVAFIPLSDAIVERQVSFGALHKKEPLFFTAPVESYAETDRVRLRKILYVLHPQFEAVLPHVLPEKHPLRVEFAAITAARKRNEMWQAVQAQVKTHLEAKEPAKALAVLEPLVFSQQPLLEAEKLLGELLYAAKRPKRTEGDAEVAEEESAEVKALRMEQLLLEFTVSRLTRSEKPADKAPAPKATPAPVRRAIPTPKRRVAV